MCYFFVLPKRLANVIGKSPIARQFQGADVITPHGALKTTVRAPIEKFASSPAHRVNRLLPHRFHDGLRLSPKRRLLLRGSRFFSWHIRSFYLKFIGVLAKPSNTLFKRRVSAEELTKSTWLQRVTKKQMRRGAVLSL